MGVRRFLGGGGWCWWLLVDLHGADGDAVAALVDAELSGAIAVVVAIAVERDRALVRVVPHMADVPAHSEPSRGHIDQRLGRLGRRLAAEV